MIHITSVSFDILGKLELPFFGILIWSGRISTSCVLMPKATMNKNY
ncbi:hypothetical protein LT85_0021 [Collimonas arenae]|uniref:Uncharacterized protein n=1 Tax=Collimonas arenae TaxID=279058 RepID=A0A0A1F3Q4_9BURK|nr:hypothetical protein LT85_0021 [Collimonas arenae]